MASAAADVEIAERQEAEFHDSSPSAYKTAKDRLLQKYSKVPILKQLPPRAIAIIVLLIFVNIFVWAAVGIVLHFHSALAGTAILAYTFGLRHALDADHISAIDLMTRRLVASGQRPVTVGTFFSLGHSTIVLITSIIVAATASAISDKFSSFSTIGGIIGSSVSAAFLLILGVVNAYILYVLVRQMRKLLQQQQQQQQQDNGSADPNSKGQDWKIEGGGVFFRIFKKLFRIVDRPWKMYPIGVLFGLGFDTSSEVALLGIASIQAAHGTSLWLILIFPALFTAGMCLLDTVDGALMLCLYTSASLARDLVAVLYYNIALTCLTVVVAVVIGTLQILGLVVAVVGDKELAGSPFWHGVEVVGDRYDIVGGCICGLFVVVGVGSVVCYQPWRRWVDARHPRPVGGFLDAADVETAVDVVGKNTDRDGAVTGDPAANGENDISAVDTSTTKGPRVSDELITVAPDN